MADAIGKIGSNDEMLAALKRMRVYNPAKKDGGKTQGAFLAQITPEDFGKTGQVPGYNDVSIHTQST